MEKVKRAGHFIAVAALFWLVFCGNSKAVLGATGTAKQKSLDEWRSLTAAGAEPPRVFVKGDRIRFYFKRQAGVEVFSAEWSKVRVPTSDYQVNSALLRWNQRLAKVPPPEQGWRRATVISGGEWRQLTTNLVSALTPQPPGHAAYFQAFLADRVLYRDAQGVPRFAPPGNMPKDVVMDRQFSVEETLEVLARLVEGHLARTHPGDSLFLLMAPNASRFTQPLLVDRQKRQCVALEPSALYDYTERGLGLAGTAQGLEALLLEGHGLALLKNPVSSAARLGNVAVQSIIKLLQFRGLKSGEAPSLTDRPGMDLDEWETWLDHYTGTRREQGSLRMLIDGEQFFTRLSEAFAQATNHIRLKVYIFDRDDVAVAVADQLKARSRDIEVKVMFDRLSSIAAGASPPATPLPEDFVPPGSILSYLRRDSQVHVRPFLNPWFSSDHSKVILVDGARAWLGGMNLGREYRYEWHDLMVEVAGPVVNSFEDQYRRSWAHEGPLGDLAYLAAAVSPPKRAEPPPGPEPWIPVRRLPTRTAWKPYGSAVFGALRKAKSYIFVENPYLFDKRVVVALVRARERGVDVRVVLPQVNDLKAGGRSNLILANYLLEHKVRVYFYPGMTHVKALLADGWTCLGSANLNHLSLRVNQEQNIATSDPTFARRVKEDLFIADFAHSYELTQPVAVDWVDFLSNLLLEGI